MLLRRVFVATIGSWLMMRWCALHWCALPLCSAWLQWSRQCLLLKGCRSKISISRHICHWHNAICPWCDSTVSSIWGGSDQENLVFRLQTFHLLSNLEDFALEAYLSLFINIHDIYRSWHIQGIFLPCRVGLRWSTGWRLQKYIPLKLLANIGSIFSRNDCKNKSAW